MFTKRKPHTCNRRHAANLFVSSLPLLACVLAGLLLSGAAAAQAQSNAQPDKSKVNVEGKSSPATHLIDVTTSPWRAHFGEHAANVLHSAGPEAKQKVIQDLIALTTTNGKIDLAATLPYLLDIAENNTSEDTRLMAVSAIAAIGTEYAHPTRYYRAMEELHQIAWHESSEQVRRATADALRNAEQNREEPQ
jgi:hypothetical protein